ncbi:MAG: MarR family winged helix-turn-helix transcriptional regulator [Armatimonadota bacterium]|nr:MarR family winged helix-turn-helix transcriptional regulator [Armatimonadota bacterium]MDR5703259.1 MarR family winged helix-turn-helix transcriptional regulator [Armatimonadota bacterium]MDR7433675.1 MarR family winged helix-turn-helix transcriptional regulator [Armatimonadota bacterium]
MARTRRLQVRVTSAGPLLDRCTSEITETVPIVMRFFRREMRKFAAPLSVPQLRALGYVYRHPGTSLSNLAGHLGVTPPTASALVERLVQRGLMKRVVDQRERRRITLTLTEKGTHMMQQVQEAIRARVRENLKRLPPSDLRRIHAGMQLLGNLFREEEGKDAC